MRLFGFARDVLARATRNQAPLLAAGVSFYFFLSLIPALVAAVSVFGLFLNPNTLETLSGTLAGLLPADAASLVQGQLEDLAGATNSSLSFGALIAIAVALWGASGGIANLLKAVNFMYETGNQRSFVAGRALALILTLGAGLLLIVVIGVLSARHWVPLFLTDSEIGRHVIEIVRWGILVAALTAALTVVFAFAPQDRQKGKPFWIGIAFATATSAVSTAGFSFYVGAFGRYQATYGTLAGVIVLLLWLWIAVWSILAGACVHAEYAERTPNSDSEGPPDATPIRTHV